MQKDTKKKIIKKAVQKYNVDSEQLKEGIDNEKEHAVGPTKVVPNDPKALSKIATAHLKEDPKYYTHLNAMEKKYKNK